MTKKFFSIEIIKYGRIHLNFNHKKNRGGCGYKGYWRVGLLGMVEYS